MGGNGSHPKRVWVDITNAPHVLVLRPIIQELRRRGHEVQLTARDYSQTLPLLDRHGLDHTSIGRHQGKSMPRKALGLAGRTARLLRFGSGRAFDIALSHGSNDLAVCAYLLRIPHVTMFDYEFARIQHNVNLRLSRKILIPDAIPSEPLYECGADDRRLDKYPGLKEEYYLSDFQPDESVLEQLGLDRSNIIVVMRTAPEASLYHRFDNDVVGELLVNLSAQQGVQTVVLPRTREQREFLRERAYPRVVVPETAVDGQSLVYFADLVVGAGGTMNREAVVLGTPAYTLFQGKMGAIDRRLIADGRLVKVERSDDVRLAKKPGTRLPEMRDPALLVDRILAVTGKAP